MRLLLTLPVASLLIMSLAKRSTAEVISLDNLETLGAGLAKRHRSIVDYVPPESRVIYSSGESVAQRLTRRKWEKLSEKFYKVAARIQKAHPKEFEKWGPLAEELGKVSEPIQQTHAQEWEQMITLLKELVTVEALAKAQKQQAYTKECEKKIKEYEAALQKAHTKYTKWKTLALIPVDKGDDSDSDV